MSTESVFVFNTVYGKLDLIGLVTGVGQFSEVCEDSVWVEMGRQPVRVMCLPKLMAAKKSAAREKDLSLLSKLEELYGPRGMHWKAPREVATRRAGAHSVAALRMNSAT